MDQSRCFLDKSMHFHHLSFHITASQQFWQTNLTNFVLKNANFKNFFLKIACKKKFETLTSKNFFLFPWKICIWNWFQNKWYQLGSCAFLSQLKMIYWISLFPQVNPVFFFKKKNMGPNQKILEQSFKTNYLQLFSAPKKTKNFSNWEKAFKNSIIMRTTKNVSKIWRLPKKHTSKT